MNQQVPSVCQPSPFFEGVSPMSATYEDAMETLNEYRRLDNEELTSLIPHADDDPALMTALGNRVDTLAEENLELKHQVACLEQRNEQLEEVEQELNAYRNDADEARSVHAEMRRTIELYEEVLQALGVENPESLFSKRYREALDICLPSDRDPRQMEFDFGGAR
jgi:chromosome segregation ATPase